MFPDQAGIAAFLEGAQAVKRRGLPEDIAAAVVYLASDGSPFVSGQTINVDGGWAMHSDERRGSRIQDGRSRSARFAVV